MFTKILAVIESIKWMWQEAKASFSKTLSEKMAKADKQVKKIMDKFKKTGRPS